MRVQHRCAWALLPVLLVTFAAGCSKADVGNRLQQAEADRDELRAKVAQLQTDVSRMRKETIPLNQENAQLRRDLLDLRSRVGDTDIPQYTHEALALYFHRELEQGRRPVHMVAATGGQFALVEQGKPIPFAQSPAEVDWAPLIQWARKHPVTNVLALHPFKGQPGYFVVDMDVEPQFYVRVIFNGHAITDYMVGTKPFGVS